MSEPVHEPIQVNRRAFLTTVAVATAVAAVSLPVLQAPAAPPRQKPTPPKGPIDVGALKDYEKDGVTDTWSQKAGAFFIVRKAGKLFAVSSICTHKYCTVTARADDFLCKCHKSYFTHDGSVTDGPAKTSLPHFGISVNADGHVLVDAAKEFTEAKWEEPGSFVKVG